MLKECSNIAEAAFKNFSLAKMALISERLEISLTNELNFYQKLSDAVGDFGAVFIENEKNTSDERISIEVSTEGISIFLGSSAFCQAANLHNAVFKFICLHLIFKIKFDGRCHNLVHFLARSHGLPIQFETNHHIEKLLSKLD